MPPDKPDKTDKTEHTEETLPRKKSAEWEKDAEGWAKPPAPSDGSPSSKAPKRRFITGWSVGIAVVGWVLAIIPITLLNAYIQLVGQCTKDPNNLCTSASERDNIPAAIFFIVLLVAGPPLLGLAVAAGKRPAPERKAAATNEGSQPKLVDMEDD